MNRFVWFAAVLSALFLSGRAPALADESVQVDVELILAVDISFSMDVEEQRLQRLGYIDALRSDAFVSAVQGGMLGSVALSYVEWAGTNEQSVIVPWTLISTAGEANAFADALAAAPLRRIFRTSISTMIEAGTRQFDGNGFDGIRKVIDISGDGPNNAGSIVTEARDAAIAQGIIINGLPLMLKRSSSRFDIERLDEYYADCVIGGIGAFVEPVRTPDQFPMAIRRKILREIAGTQPSLPRVWRVAERAPSDCLIGEKLWRERALQDR